MNIRSPRPYFEIGSLMRDAICDLRLTQNEVLQKLHDLKNEQPLILDHINNDYSYDKTNGNYAWHWWGRETLLQAAARRGLREVVRLLLEWEADPNLDPHLSVNLDPKQYFNNTTPLMLAASEGQSKVARLLLAHGAEVDKANNELETPLQLAAKNGHTDVVKLLLKHGAEVNKVNHALQTPLMWAGRYPNVVNVLLNHGAEVNQVGSSGGTALGYAVSGGNDGATIKALLSHNASVELLHDQEKAALKEFLQVELTKAACNKRTSSARMFSKRATAAHVSEEEQKKPAKRMRV